MFTPGEPILRARASYGQAYHKCMEYRTPYELYAGHSSELRFCARSVLRPGGGRASALRVAWLAFGARDVGILLCTSVRPGQRLRAGASHGVSSLLDACGACTHSFVRSQCPGSGRVSGLSMAWLTSWTCVV